MSTADAAAAAAPDGGDAAASRPKFHLGGSTESELSPEGEKAKATLRRQQETASETPPSKFFLVGWLVS